MKKHFTLLAILLFSISGFSQSYYETSWLSGDIKYTALVIFYQENEAMIRVKYYANGSDKLASYVCTYKEFKKSDGTTDRYLDGNDAYIIEGPYSSSYSADNFYLKGNGTTIEAYTADDNTFKGGDFTQSMKPMLYWVKLNPESLTKGYLDDYFKKDENAYHALAFINKGEISFSTNANSVSILTSGFDQKTIWATVMDSNQNTSYTEQRIKESKNFPSDWIKEQWDDGFSISAFDFDDNKNKFTVLMSKGLGLGLQSWRKSDTFPKDWISERWNNGYLITSMMNANGKWYLAMNKSTEYDTQKWKTSHDLPRDWIIDNWNEGYAITSAAYGNDLWALTMSKGSKLGAQTWKTKDEFPFEWIEERAKKGYAITTITYGNGSWLVVMSKSASSNSNEYRATYSEIPIGWILSNTQ